jgi:hypothetical protein
MQTNFYYFCWYYVDVIKRLNLFHTQKKYYVLLHRRLNNCPQILSHPKFINLYSEVKKKFGSFLWTTLNNHPFIEQPCIHKVFLGPLTQYHSSKTLSLNRNAKQNALLTSGPTILYIFYATKNADLNVCENLVKI